jgi:hypothetical protein
MNLEAGVSEVSTHPFGPVASGRQMLTLGTLPLLKSYTTLLIPNQKRSDQGKHQLFVGYNPLCDTAPTSVSFIGNLLLPNHCLIIKVPPP